jgi:hypothetical protein
VRRTTFRRQSERGRATPLPAAGREGAGGASGTLVSIGRVVARRPRLSWARWSCRRSGSGDAARRRRSGAPATTQPSGASVRLAPPAPSRAAVGSGSTRIVRERALPLLRPSPDQDACRPEMRRLRNPWAGDRNRGPEPGGRSRGQRGNVEVKAASAISSVTRPAQVTCAQPRGLTRCTSARWDPTLPRAPGASSCVQLQCSDGGQGSAPPGGQGHSPARYLPLPQEPP